MDFRENAEERMSGYKTKLDLINRVMAEEMNKVYNQRQVNLLLFLHLEKAVYSQAFAELDGILQGVTKHRGNSVPRLNQERCNDSTIATKNQEITAHSAGRTYRILTWGGIGDVLLITPAIRKIKQLYPDCKIHVYCVTKSHKEALMNNKYIDRLLTLGRLTRFIVYLITWFNLLKIRRVDIGNLGPNIFYHKNAAEIIGEMLGVQVDDPRPECFLTEEEEEEARRIVVKHPNPVAIHVTGKSSPNKSWLTGNWGNLVLNNPQYTFLQLGSADDEPIQGVVNLCGKTSIRQAFSIVKMASAFVGVDSGLAHAAAAFHKPAVILFGASTPVVWGHAGNINLYNPPPCSPCMDILSEDPCPYGRTCMANIAVSDVERALASLIAQAHK